MKELPSQLCWKSGRTPICSKLNTSHALLSCMPLFLPIISYMGKTNFTYKLHGSLIIECISANISSPNTEFDTVALRIKPAFYIPHSRNVTIEDKLLLHSGLSINFEGSMHAISPRYIQYTKSLLMSVILKPITCRNIFREILFFAIGAQQQTINYFLSTILTRVDIFFHISEARINQLFNSLLSVNMVFYKKFKRKIV
jgi:hypothetical protein